MPLFSVALFLEKTTGNTTSQRMVHDIVEAVNHDHALGLFIRSEDRKFREYPIVYHSVIDAQKGLPK